MLEIGSQKFGVEDTFYAVILKTVGNAYLDINLDSSIAFTKRTIAIQKVKIPVHAEHAKRLNNLGIAYYYQGELKETAKYWSEALAIRKVVLGKTHTSYMGILLNLGNLYMALGQYPKAIKNFSYAKNLFEEANLTEHPFYVNCLNNLGIVYETISDYEKSESYYLQTINVQKKYMERNTLLT
jgi:tetratricopeptide (TPR) repeat protein